MEIETEADYLDISERYAKELLAIYKPEDLAIIAAQHIILSDARNRTNVEIKNVEHAQKEIFRLQEQHIQLLKEHKNATESELKNKLSQEQVVQVTSTVLDAFKKAKFGKAGKARAAKHYDKSQALADWETKGHNFSSPRAFSELEQRKYNVKSETLYRWILEHRKLKSKDM